MPIHHFTLIVDGVDLQDESVVNSLFESGCDDALIGVVDGVQFVDFDRDAASLDEAVLSAVADIERVDGVRVVRVADAGLAAMADVAARTGRTREGVRLLVSGARGPGGFPPPITDPRGRYRLWRWSDVQRWFRSEVGEEIPLASEERLVTAINARALNSASSGAGWMQTSKPACGRWRISRSLRRRTRRSTAQTPGRRAAAPAPLRKMKS